MPIRITRWYNGLPLFVSPARLTVFFYHLFLPGEYIYLGVSLTELAMFPHFLSWPPYLIRSCFAFLVARRIVRYRIFLGDKRRWGGGR